jgi:hypothetical protein
LFVWRLSLFFCLGTLSLGQNAPSPTKVLKVGLLRE